MKKMILLSVLCAIVAAAFVLMRIRNAGFKSVETAKFAEILQNDTAVQLLDVRSPMEYAEGHLPGAVLIDVKDSTFLSKAKEMLSQNRPVAVYCRSGRRSATAAAMLVKAGYDVVNLKGGILAWQSDGREIVGGEAEKQLLEQEVEQRVRNIYDEVFGWYLAHINVYGQNDTDHDKYYSKDYRQTISDVARVDAESEDIGFFDYDHWIQGQDWDKDLAMEVESVEILDVRHACAHIRITNCGTKSSVVLTMVKEDGEWFIDDFVTPGAGNSSEKSDMKQYIKERSKE